MKKVLQCTLFFAAISAGLILQSCNKLKDAIPAQDISYTSTADLVIAPISDTTSQVAIGQIAVSYNLDSMISAQTSGKLGFSNIQSVKITGISLALSDADAADNFANFTYVGAAFYSDANSTPYTIAHVDNNPDNYSASLSPAVASADQDVKNYFSANMMFHYQLTGKLRRATTNTLHCHAVITYTINVKA